MPPRHITGLYALRRLTAARATFLLGQSVASLPRSHAKTPPHGVRPVWAHPTSHTARTLGVMQAELIGDIFE
jgi:hypothetical protein